MPELTFATNALGAIRRETHNGRDFIVAPAVALVEGVLNGELVPADEFGRYIDAWNGRPIPVGHPKKNGQHVSANRLDVDTVGQFFNARLDGNKLKGEMWFDVARLDSVGRKGQELKQKLENNETVELSTAYFRDVDPTPGTHDGRHYEAVQRNLRPDHIAVLLDTEGACSIRDGCGVPRINESCEQCAQLEDDTSEGEEPMTTETPGGLPDEHGTGETENSELTLLQKIAGTLEKMWKKESDMDELIQELAANEDVPFDADELEEFEEERLQAIAALADKPAANEEEEEEPDTEPDPTPTPDESGDDVPAWAQDLQASVDALQGEVSELKSEAEAATNAKRDEIVGRLVANESCTLSKEQLQAMELDVLKGLESSFKPANYGGRGGFHGNTDDGVLIEAPMPTLNGGD